MSKTLSEDSEGKRASANEFGTRQLFRRPAPTAGSSTITCLRAFRDYGTGLVVASASETPVTFDQWENEDSAIFGETLSSGALQKVSFKAQGVYAVTISAKWEAQFDGVTEICWLDDSTTAGNDDIIGNNMGQFGSGRAADSFEYPLTLSITQKFPRYTTTSGDVSGGVYGRIFTKVMQRSGTNKDLSQVTLDIFYWGPTLTSI